MTDQSFTTENAIPPGSSYDASSLKGKSVIITGGASGIGAAAARAFVAAGAFVTLGDINLEQGEQIVKELGKDRAALVKCDSRDWKDQVNLFKTALAASPSKGIDVVLANAGIIGQDDIFAETAGPDGEPVEPNINIVYTNLVGVLYTVKLALHYFPRQAEGADRDRCLVMTSSLAGYIDHPGAPQYEASKFGIRGVMRTIRRTGPSDHIRVNIIAPAFIATSIMSEDIKAKIRAAGVEFAHAEDAADAILHLSADKTINGRALAIVPRSEDPRGYFDLKCDDIDDDPVLGSWSRLSAKVRVRAGSK